jgi:hypothetical protein
MVLRQFRQNPERLFFASRLEQCRHSSSWSSIPAWKAIASMANRFNEIRRSLAAEANARFSEALRHLRKITRSSGMLARSIALCQEALNCTPVFVSPTPPTIRMADP